MKKFISMLLVLSMMLVCLSSIAMAAPAVGQEPLEVVSVEYLDDITDQYLKKKAGQNELGPNTTVLQVRNCLVTFSDGSVRALKSKTVEFGFDDPADEFSLWTINAANYIVTFVGTTLDGNVKAVTKGLTLSVGESTPLFVEPYGRHVISAHMIGFNRPYNISTATFEICY